MEQDPRARDRERAKGRAVAIPAALPLHPVTDGVREPVETAAVAKVKDKAADGAAADDRNLFQ
jgi:hypothetical protein